DGDELGRGSEPAETVAAGRGLLGRVLDVGDDVALLFRGQLAVGELGHVLRAGQHGRVDLLLAGGRQRRGVLAGGQRAALAGEVVAGRAVHPEQLRTAADVVTAQRLLGDLAVLVADDAGATAVGGDVGAERVDLLGVELGGLARGLGLVGGQRHAAGGDLEVDRGLTDADEARAAVGHALQVDTVAGDAGGVVELLSLADQRGLVL